MFGRRKHVAEPAPAPAAVLDADAVFAAAEERLRALFGPDGEWTVVRRTASEADDFFRELFVTATAADVTAAVLAGSASAGRARTAAEPVAATPTVTEAEGGPSAALAEAVSEPASPAAVPVRSVETVGAEHVDTAAPTSDAREGEPVAMSWQPAPITVWADLKRPVTGPIALQADAAA